MRFFILASALACTSSLLAQTPEATVATGKFECKQGTAARQIEALSEGEGCKVNYTKEDGSTKAVWTAVKGTDFCKEKAQGLSDKLNGMGWTCAPAQ